MAVERAKRGKKRTHCEGKRPLGQKIERKGGLKAKREKSKREKWKMDKESFDTRFAKYPFMAYLTNCFSILQIGSHAL